MRGAVHPSARCGAGEGVTDIGMMQVLWRSQRSGGVGGRLGSD